MRQLHKRHDETGNALVEFGLCFPVLILLLFGVVTGGLALDRYMTVLQLGRTGASMMSRGVDFNSTQNKQLFLRGAADLGINLNSGRGVIYLTRQPPGPQQAGTAVSKTRSRLLAAAGALALRLCAAMTAAGEWSTGGTSVRLLLAGRGWPLRHLWTNRLLEAGLAPVKE
jgi:Flp pilus assembly protein TadG